jgi:hypothetical protein
MAERLADGVFFGSTGGQAEWAIRGGEPGIDLDVFFLEPQAAVSDQGAVPVAPGGDVVTQTPRPTHNKTSPKNSDC